MGLNPQAATWVGGRSTTKTFLMRHYWLFNSRPHVNMTLGPEQLSSERQVVNGTPFA